MTLRSGTRLGPYEILGAIGAGGMGEVYRARDTRLDRAVAIKVLPADFAGDPERLARFAREAKAVAALSHPNIVAIHDFRDEGGTTFAVTELLLGQTLRERLGDGPLPVPASDRADDRQLPARSAGARTSASSMSTAAARCRPGPSGSSWRPGGRSPGGTWRLRIARA